MLRSTREIASANVSLLQCASLAERNGWTKSFILDGGKCTIGQTVVDDLTPSPDFENKPLYVAQGLEKRP